MYKSIIIILFSCLPLLACTNSFFQPLKQHLASPEQFDIEYEDIYFNQQSGPELHGWWFPSKEQAKANILFLHGNGENISSHAGLVFWLTQHQYNVFIFDYRGYGKSKGSAQIEGVMNDIQSARNYVQSRTTPAEKIFIIGHSLGASLGIYNLAHHTDNIDGIILVSPFSDYRKVTRETLNKSWITWAIQWPASFTISTDYNPIHVVEQLPAVPKLFIYSQTDQMIAAHHVIDLYQHASLPKEIKQVPGQHNSLFAQKTTQQTILKYLNSWSE